MLIKYNEDLKLALRHLQIADHIAYVTYPLVNEKRLLLKILEEIGLAISYSINCMFNYKHPERPIDIKKGSIDINKILEENSRDYMITNEQLIKIREILDLNKKHKESGIEFVKRDKIVILSDNLNFLTINIQKIKEYILLAKRLIIKINLKIGKDM